MTDIECPFHSVVGNESVCEIVAELLERPLVDCVTSDAACEHCLKCRVAPQRPNYVTASLAIHTVRQMDDDARLQSTIARFLPFLGQEGQPTHVTTCVLRGLEIRKVACKPCQAGSLDPVMMPVYSCPQHKECTLHNTGTFPKITACATCRDRMEQYVQIDAKPIPAIVLSAMPRRGIAAL